MLPSSKRNRERDMDWLFEELLKESDQVVAEAVRIARSSDLESGRRSAS